jgi:hypothetical protein
MPGGSADKSVSGRAVSANGRGKFLAPTKLTVVESEGFNMNRTSMGILAAVTIFIGGVGATSAAAPATKNLGGTWHGSFSQIGGVLYVAEGRCVLEIHDDGTFNATVTPGPGANNLVKGSKWSGTVVRHGDRYTFRTPNGPSTTLVRQGDTLYGVANDPLTESDIMIKLDRQAG